MAEWKEAAQARSGVSHGDGHYEARAGIALVIVLKIKIKTGPGPVGTGHSRQQSGSTDITGIVPAAGVIQRGWSFKSLYQASRSQGGVHGLALMWRTRSVLKL